LRRDTPGCESVIHLNNAGAGLVSSAVTQRMIKHLLREEEIGGYEAADEIANEWAQGKSEIADFVGTQAHNVALVESTTVGFHRVLSTLPLRRGDRILVASSEYASTVLPLLQLSRRIGIRVEFIPDSESTDTAGTVDLAAFDRMLDDSVRLVCAVHAPSHNGLVNDIIGMGDILRARGLPAWFVVDACQSIGQLPVDVAAMNADFLVASGRKFLRGPRGSGVLVVGDRALAQLDAFPVDIAGASWVHSDDFHTQPGARRYETYERSVAVGLGLMTATRYANSLGIATIAERISRHAEYLRSHIGALAGWSVLDRGRRRSGIVTVRHHTITAEQAALHLKSRNVNTHVVSATTNPRDLGNRPVLRLSPHIFNTPSELDFTVNLLAQLADH